VYSTDRTQNQTALGDTMLSSEE
jgi:hypothetical protein